MKYVNKKILIFALFAAIGMCMFNGSIMEVWLDNNGTRILNFLCKNIFDNRNLFNYLINMFPIICGMFAIPYWCVIFSKFYEIIISSLKKVFSTYSKKDYIFLSIIFIIMCCFAIYSFNSTDIFYSKNVASCDIVYTSDSPELVYNNVWLNIYHPENDLRQPLFAVFSAPFFAPIYLVSKIIPFDNIEPILMISTNIFLMLIIYLVISELLSLKNMTRRCFITLLMSMHCSILFSIMLEQYTVALFWLILFIFRVLKKEDGVKITFIGTTGTLLTNVISFPLMLCSKLDIKNIIKKLICIGLIFLFVLLFFGRIDVLLNLGSKLVQFTKYTGVKLTLQDRLLQYISFIKNCFLAPSASLQLNRSNIISWQLNEITSLDCLGLVILLLSIIGFICNRKDKIAQISMLWVIYSFFLLCLVGWGTAENGLILYSLYFGWAFCILIHYFIKYIFSKYKFEKGIVFSEYILSILMLMINLPQMLEMITNLKVLY